MTAESDARQQHHETRALIVRSEKRIHNCIVSTVAVAALALGGLMLALTSVLLAH